MKFSSLKWALSIGLLAFLLNGPVHAQFYPTSARPAISPYVNLLRGNSNSLTLNYYGLVQPQFQFYGANAGLQQQIGGLQQQYSGLEQQQNKQNASGIQ